MKCPRCPRELESLCVGGVDVDVCRHGCGGIWFDHWEIQRFDDPEDVADQLLAGIEVDLSLDVDLTRRVSCPRCDDTVLMRRPYSKEIHVFIDECPSCGGIWLDYGELFAIREGLRAAGEAPASSSSSSRSEAAEVLRRIVFHRQGGGS